MELAAPISPLISVQEYFRLAEASPTKLEYKSGRIIDMAGTTYDHSRIVANTIRELGNRLKGGPCEATGSDTRVKASDDRYCYPDVVVVCGEVAFDPLDPRRSVTNSRILFEVLSPTTEVMDRGEKFFHYIRMESMREYFLVAQDRPRIESFVRQADGSWSVGAIAEGIDATLRLTSLDVAVPLNEIYANVQFGPAA